MSMVSVRLTAPGYLDLSRYIGRSSLRMTKNNLVCLDWPLPCTKSSFVIISFRKKYKGVSVNSFDFIDCTMNRIVFANGSLTLYSLHTRPFSIIALEKLGFDGSEGELNSL